MAQHPGTTGLPMPSPTPSVGYTAPPLQADGEQQRFARAAMEAAERQQAMAAQTAELTRMRDVAEINRSNALRLRGRAAQARASRWGRLGLAGLVVGGLAGVVWWSRRPRTSTPGAQP